MADAQPNIIGWLASGRPVVQNADGSRSTHKNMVVGLGDAFYIVPTLYGGKEYSPDEAVDIIRRNKLVDPDTRETLQPYRTEKEALAVERDMHKLLEREPMLPAGPREATGPSLGFGTQQERR